MTDKEDIKIDALHRRIKELEDALAVTAAHITAAEIEIDHAEIENLTLQARLKELEGALAITAAIDDVAIVRAVMRAKEMRLYRREKTIITKTDREEKTAYS